MSSCVMCLKPVTGRPPLDRPSLCSELCEKQMENGNSEGDSTGKVKVRDESPNEWDGASIYSDRVKTSSYVLKCINCGCSQSFSMTEAQARYAETKRKPPCPTCGGFQILEPDDIKAMHSPTKGKNESYRKLVWREVSAA